MNRYDRILIRLARTARGAGEEPVAPLPPVLATRVLSRLKANGASGPWWEWAAARAAIAASAVAVVYLLLPAPASSMSDEPSRIASVLLSTNLTPE